LSNQPTDSKPTKTITRDKKVIDTNQIYDLYYNKGLSQRQIAELSGHDRSTITRRLQRLESLVNQDSPKIYDQHIQTLYKGATVEFLLDALSPEKRKKDSGYQSMLKTGIAQDKLNIITGQAPDTTSINIILREVERDMDMTIELQRELDDRLKQLAPIDSKVDDIETADNK